MFPIIKFLHVTCGVSFFGITIAHFFYIARSYQKHDRSLIDYSIKASYFGDAVIFFCIVIQLITSFYLVSAGHFTLAVPWIFVAYHAFGLLVLLWISIVLLKKFYFSIKGFYILNSLMILTFIIIIHDAVMQSTGFEFLFRK
jgi:uncharacterized membrane protein